MNFEKWFAVSFFFTVFSFLGFLISTVLCWAVFVSLDVFIIATAPFLSMTLIFFLCFVILGEKVKENLKINKVRKIIRNSKNILAGVNNIIYVNNRAA